MLRRTLLIAAVAIAIAAVHAAPVRADDGKALLFINLTSDDVWTQQMALGFADKVLDMGHPVAVFLNVRAVGLGNKTVPQHVEAGTGKNGHQILQALIAKGARIFLCPGCTQQAGLKVEDRLDGIELGGLEMRQLLMQPVTKVLSY